MPHQPGPLGTPLERYLRVVSGDTRGLGPTLTRLGLSLVSLPYALAVRARNAAYDRGWLSVHRPSVPVVSLGNLTTGGTGKTPLAAFLAHWFQKQDLRPVFLSRGYHAPPGEKNDEALVLEKLCPDVLHFQQPNRIAASNLAVNAGADLLILDDGFQHRKLHRDLNILVIDALQPWGYGHLLPRGLLRESLHAARRADLILLSRADLVSEIDRQEIGRRLIDHGSTAPVVEIAFLPETLRNASGEARPLEQLQNKKVGLFCGIGNPDGFRQTVTSLGVDPEQVVFRTFPDHHHYKASDLVSLAEWGHSHGCHLLLTTLKDLVKIPHSELGRIGLWALNIAPRILTGKEALNHALTRIAELAKRRVKDI